MTILKKICGLSTPDAVKTAVTYGAAYLGFIFFPPSPRHITPPIAAAISADVPASVKKVAVTVDMADEDIAALLAVFGPDYLQLHGKETPERVQEIRVRYGLPVIKALSVRTKGNILHASRYDGVADMLLFDAKPPEGAVLPGGNGVSFDWTLLKGEKISLPWFLSGGLSCQNIREALDNSGASMVDVSSGVETRPGVKDLRLIREFLELTA
jgi:phosphoribosylanthranilate isomerase